MDAIPWQDIMASGGGTAVAAVALGMMVWRKLNRIETAMTQLAARAGFVMDNTGNLIPVDAERRAAN